MDHGRPSLCESCRWVTLVRGPKVDDKIVECTQLSYRNRNVPFAVTSCSDYLNRNQPTIADMQAIAWVLRSDPLRNRVGFVHSSKLPDDERYVLPDE